MRFLIAAFLAATLTGCFGSGERINNTHYGEWYEVTYNTDSGQETIMVRSCDISINDGGAELRILNPATYMFHSVGSGWTIRHVREKVQ